ncbi:MAG: antirestriction protein ArdA [Clostridia bacterium]
MRLTIQRPTTKKEISINLPTDEKALQSYCDELSIGNDMRYGVIVTDTPFDEKMKPILIGNQYNLTELNFLFQSLDRFADDEMTTFYAVATAKKMTDIKDLINLSFNEQCYSLVDDFSDIQSLGKRLYLQEQGGASEEELHSLDGQKYVEDLIAKNPTPLVSPYGFVYPNKNEPEILYTGKTFPQYLNGLDVFYVALRTETATDHLDLPCEQSEINKAMERLEIDNLDNTTLTVLMHNLPGPLEEILYEVEHDLHALNDVAKVLHDVGEREWKTLARLCRFTEVETVADLKLLCGSLHEFEMLPNIHTAEDYGRYMICDSGRFEYDDNLEGYINFKAYGEYRLSVENGAFTNEGYLIYHGYNMELAGILEEVGIEVPQGQTEEVRLYMPLKVITYDQENDWGVYENTGYEEELDSCELLSIEDALTAKMAEYSKCDGERGLMSYYDKNDTVNAKIHSFHLDFEEVNGDMFGVAVLKINAPLTEAEWADIKDYVTGQCSDGAGESFEQREFSLDGRDVYVSLWNSEGAWELKTAEDMGIAQPQQNFDMKMI